MILVPRYLVQTDYGGEERIIDDDFPRPCSSGIEDGEAGEIWMMMMMMMMLLFVRCVCKGM